MYWLVICSAYTSGLKPEAVQNSKTSFSRLHGITYQKRVGAFHCHNNLEYDAHRRYITNHEYLPRTASATNTHVEINHTSHKIPTRNERKYRLSDTYINLYMKENINSNTK
jgi:hypothetical protein